MRILIPFCLLMLCVSFTGAPQKSFIEISEDSDQYADWINTNDYNFTMADVFKYPERERILIDPAAMDSIAGYDFSKLQVESLSIHAGMLCDEPDSSRAAFAEQMKKAMSRISCFAKCPKLKRVVFIIGNHVFLTNAQSRPRLFEEIYSTRYDKRLTPRNLQAAWKLFGTDVQQQLPGIPLYAVSEYW